MTTRSTELSDKPKVKVDQHASDWMRRLGIGAWNPQQQSEAYLFLALSLLGFVIFIVFPIVYSLWLSFQEWDLLTAPEFTGLSNYTELITNDDVFRRVLFNTLFYALTIPPIQLVLGLLMAVALDTGIKGLGVYRVIYFMPVVTNIVAAAMIFQFLLDKNAGLLPSWIWQFNEATGIRVIPPDFLGSSFWAKPSVVILTVWKNVGFTMVIYLAGLQAVPDVLYDASKVDGASAWQRFRFITVPMVSSTTFFLFVIQMIGAFQLFAEPFVMTRGGPANASLSIVYYIYQNAFQYQKMGKAAAIAWILFGIIFVVTFIQIRLQNRWVHYEAEESAS
jgi:multiple sugar transport system permease protein